MRSIFLVIIFILASHVATATATAATTQTVSCNDIKRAIDAGIDQIPLTNITMQYIEIYADDCSR